MVLYHAGNLSSIKLGGQGFHASLNLEDAKVVMKSLARDYRYKVHPENLKMYEVITEDLNTKYVPGDLPFWGGKDLNDVLSGEDGINIDVEHDIWVDYEKDFEYTPVTIDSFEESDESITSKIAKELEELGIDGFIYRNINEIDSDSIVIYNISKIISFKEVKL